jgi:hypothetical protein
MRIRVFGRCTREQFVPTLAEMLPFFRLFPGFALFVREMIHLSIFSIGPSRQREALVRLPRRVGSSEVPWRILSVVKKTLYRHRAGFEPQRAFSFMKWVKAPRTWRSRPGQNDDPFLYAIHTVGGVDELYLHRSVFGDHHPARNWDGR